MCIFNSMGRGGAPNSQVVQESTVPNIFKKKKKKKFKFCKEQEQQQKDSTKMTKTKRRKYGRKIKNHGGYGLQEVCVQS